MIFEGLRVEPSGAIVAYLPAGVVRLEPDEADAGRAPGWYDWSWRGAPDPTVEARGDATKVSKASVNYGAPPFGSAARCGVCTMFLPPAACTYVAGEIEPEKWCEDFEMKLDDAKLDEALRRADAMSVRSDMDDQKRDELGRFAANATNAAHVATSEAIANKTEKSRKNAARLHNEAATAHANVMRAYPFEHVKYQTHGLAATAHGEAAHAHKIGANEMYTQPASNAAVRAAREAMNAKK